MVIVLSRFRVANAMEADVARAFRDRPRAVDTVAGFLGLEVLTDNGDRSTFHLLTRWTTHSAYEVWHRSADHRASHAFIPKGLKLDPAFTQVLTLERLDGVAAHPLVDVVQDATLLFADYAANATGFHVFRVTSDGAIVTCNPAACRVLAGGESLAGRHLSEFMTHADAERLQQLLATAGRTHTPVMLNFAAPRGVPYTLECWLDVQAGGATVVGEPNVRGEQMLHDSLMAMNQELAVLSRERSRDAVVERRRREDADRLNEERNEFLTVLVHELRQPLGGALAALGVLRKLNDDPALSRPRAHLDRQLRQIERLTEDLADTARIAGGHVRLAPAPIDIISLLRELSMSWEETAERDHKPFHLTAPAERAVIDGDAGRLQQIFSNLVGNAFKYTAPGGSVSVAVAIDAGRVVVQVSDEGEGIPPDKIETVFDLFKRATGSASGLGVGLAVVRGLVQAHGGTVTAQSDGVGRGATFTVRLPLASRPTPP